MNLSVTCSWQDEYGRWSTRESNLKIRDPASVAQSMSNLRRQSEVVSTQKSRRLISVLVDYILDVSVSVHSRVGVEDFTIRWPFHLLFNWGSLVIKAPNAVINFTWGNSAIEILSLMRSQTHDNLLGVTGKVGSDDSRQPKNRKTQVNTVNTIWQISKITLHLVEWGRVNLDNF